MIRYLAIRNLAVIESVAVDFEQSFNILTGETGAGKSILVEAVGLLLGGRATHDLIRTGEDIASVEAMFETADGEELIVRREITSQGRSRAFINGALATAAALKDLSNRLVELHGQHEHQQLLDPSQHLALLDTWAGLDAPRARVATAFATVRGTARATRSPAHGRPRAGRPARPGGVPAGRAAEGQPPGRRGRNARRRPAAAAQRRHHPSPLQRRLRRVVRHRVRGARRTWPGLEAGGGAGGHRPAVRAVPGCPRRHQGAARRPGVHAARLCRRHRRVAGTTPAGRRSAGPDRAAEAQARRHARGGDRASRSAGGRAPGPDRRPVDGRRDRAAARRRRPAVPGRGARPVSARRRAADEVRQEHRDRAGRTGHGQDEVRGPADEQRVRRPMDRAPASTRASSSCRRTSARNSGRWRASSRAASCRGSCWR